MKISIYFNVVLITGNTVNNEGGPEVNVSVIGGEKLPEMTPEQEIKVCYNV